MGPDLLLGQPSGCRRRRRPWVWWCALLLVSATAGCEAMDAWFGDKSVLARVTEIAGDVTIRSGEDAPTTPAALGSILAEGDVVTTGEESSAVLEFDGGNVVRLEPNTSLVIQHSGGTSAQIGAVLLDGSAKTTSSGAGVLLSIGTPFGITTVGDGEAELTLSTEQGITVLVGEVVVTLEDGESRTIGAGSSLTIDGLVVPLGDEGEANLTLEPITVVLLANPRQVQVKRAEEEKWAQPKRRDVLDSGDAVRTRKAGETFVRFGEAAGLRLDNGSELTLSEAGLSSTEHHAVYALASGSAHVSMNRGKRKTAEHVIDANGTELRVQAGLREADVSLSTAKNGKTTIAVQFGRVLLPDGTVVDAGSALTLDNGKPSGSARPLAATDISLRPSSSSIVYYQRDIPPVAFNLRGSKSPGPTTIEVAKDRDFNQVVFQEKLDGDSFVYRGFKSGRYYWRVSQKGSEGESKGTLLIKKGSSTDCANCKRTNVINDTGEKTVVYYQQALPAITLRWKTVAGAAKYIVKVFRDGDFDNPLVNEDVAETTVAFRSGRLGEGKYYWLVTAKDAGNNDLSAGRMNSLEIAYDNAITDIVIKTPRQGARVSSSRLVTSGEVQLGARLSINGRSTSVDRQGRFRQSVSLSKGRNHIVYRTVAPDGIERYYVRDVTRR